MREATTTNPCGDAGRLSGSLRTLFDVGTLSGLTDGQLLERFLRGRGGTGEGPAEAEAAFAALVERHGPMVLGVCRAVLGDRHDAEDACQAAFLVLARRAGTIRKGDSVASWLYGAARRIAARARRDLSRRRELERRRRERVGPSEPVASPPAESCPELYEELDGLPGAFRAAVVLCDLEGQTYEQAAARLGCPVGTVQSRLSRGRERLRRRLERRGIAPGLVGIVASPAALSPQLTAAIARGAVGILGGRTIAGAAPAAVAAMAGAEVRRRLMNRLAMTGVVLLAAGLTATAVLVAAAGGRGAAPKPEPQDATPKPYAGPIHVRVVDLEGKAVPGIAVEVRGEDGTRTIATDAGGRATILRGFPDRWAHLIARGQGGTLAWGRVGVPEWDRPKGTEDEPIVLKLLPVDHRVEGSVVDRAGRPVAGVTMRANYLGHPINGSILFEAGLEDLLAPAITDRAGRFAAALPREANAGLMVAHPRYLGGLAVEPGERALAPAVLEPAGSIAGRAIDAATGRPVAGAVLGAQLLEHRAHGHGGWGETIADDQGRFHFDGLEPGVHNLLLLRVPGRPDATARAVEAIRVKADSDTTADLAVIEGRPMRGVVVDRDTGEPVPGIEVGCYGPARPRSGAAVESQRTDDRGRFTFHVPPGDQYVYLMTGLPRTRLENRIVRVPEQGEIAPVRLVRWIHQVQNPMMAVAKVAAPAVKKVAVPEPDEPAGAEAPAATKEAASPREGAAVAEVAVAETTADPDAPRVRTVTGRVLDRQGRPVGGVQLQAAPDPFAPMAGPQNFDLPTTDRDGLFVFPDLPRWPLQITLTRPGCRYQLERLPADRDEVKWTYDLVPDPKEGDPSARNGDEPVPDGLRDRLTFVDLDPSGNDYLSDGPDGGGNDLNRLPRGIHKLGETYFRVGEKMVHLQGRMRADLPRSVKGIAVRARGRVLHFLHSTSGGADMEDRIVGVYVIHYADGSVEQASVVYSRDLTNWWHRDPGRRITRAKVAWTGVNDTVEMNAGLKVRLYEMAWTNPHPDKEIASIDFVSSGKECDPFLVALTVEP